jgi:Ca-activated chloride channel family protein
MFNRSAYENSRAGGIGVLEVADGGEPDEKKPRLFVPLKRTELKGEITGPLASLRLTQVYGYSKEQMDKVLEAVYRFPLPGDAAVKGVTVTFGDVEIKAELKEREQAEQDYEKAKKEGRQAALATRESPDVFTLQVAGIRPDEDVKVETSYVQLARADGEGWSLRVPLTTAPRYVRSDEFTSRHAHGQPLLLMRDPGHRFSLDLTLPGASSVSSDTHGLSVDEIDTGVAVRLEEGEIVPDRDCVLSWQARREEARPTLQVMLHEEPSSNWVYFLALVAPPTSLGPEEGVAREAILVVDHSGSMYGPKWEAADWAVEQFLLDLTPADEFALCLFHNTTLWFADRPRRVEPDTIDAAVQFLLEHKDSGGTELGVALEQALHLKRSTNNRARHLVIVTDAQVTDAGRILRLADEEARRDHRRRISVLCIDAAPNSFLASELAERGGGVSRFLTSSPDELDITTALDEVLKDWAQPVMADLRLEVDRPDVQSGNRRVTTADRGDRTFIDLGDLPRGRALWVTGRAPRGDNGALHFRAAMATGEEVSSQTVDLGQENNVRPALKVLFGARRVLGLEHLINSGYSLEDIKLQLEHLQYDAEEVLGREVVTSKVYAENVREDARKALRSLLVQEALEYGLASAETAFVAMRKEAGKNVEGTIPVASALPLGWSEHFLASAPISRPARGAGALFKAAALYAPDALSLQPRADSGRGHVGRPHPLASTAAFMPEASEPPEPTVIFSGIPTFVGNEAVLFDSSGDEDEDRFPESAILRLIEVRFPEGKPDPASLNDELALTIFVGDLASPRAKVRMVEMVRRRGQRPLNVAKAKADTVRVVLIDPKGAWRESAPRIEVALAL